MSFRTYNPMIHRVKFAGSPPSSTNILVDKIDENLVAIVSG
jgi:hypothetical protein